MYPNGYKHDPEAVKAILHEMDDGSVVVKSDCSIQIPARYLSKEMAFFGDDVSIFAFFAIILPDGRFGTSQSISMIYTDPDSTDTIKINDEEYIVLQYNENSTIFKSTDLIIKSTLSYNAYAYFIDSGYIPWFLRYVDVINSFKNSVKNTGVKPGSNHAMIPMIASNIARKPSDKNVYIRQTLKGVRGIIPNDIAPSYIPFKSVLFGPKTTTALLSGNYMDTALTAALVNPNTKPESLEEILRL